MYNVVYIRMYEIE